MDLPGRRPSPERLGVPHASGDGPTARPPSSRRRRCSPREWGWTDARHSDAPGDDVFPTRVGMDRSRPSTRARTASVPHASGDGPRLRPAICAASTCSPREWGWTDLSEHLTGARHVFPTRVGMDRRRRAAMRPSACVPHASGDGPTIALTRRMTHPCSPREWGWTVWVDPAEVTPTVFPTRVGMDRSRHREPIQRTRVPHASGDGPPELLQALALVVCSPREWGWTDLQEIARELFAVFPTRVGMDRHRPDRKHGSPRVPHASGDGPPAHP